MKPEPTLIEEQMYDMLDAWYIATHVDQATEFKKRYPFLANDMIYTYRLSYCALLCKLIDPAKQKIHMNLCFESEIDSMKNGPRKAKAQELLAKIRQISAQYRTVRNKIGSHSSRQVMRSRRAITTPTVEKTEKINGMLSDLYELVFRSVFPSPPVQTPNDLSALLAEVESNKSLHRTLKRLAPFERR
jgi:glutaredoxin